MQNSDRFPPAREITARLQGRGITPTPQRIEIARQMLARLAHFSAEAVYQVVNGGGERVSRATVYNTLDLLVAKGLLRQLVVDANRVFYDSNTAPHHHLFDLDTGVLTDVDEVTLPVPPNLPPATEIERVDVIFRIRRRP